MERIAIILTVFLVFCSTVMASNCGKAVPRNTPEFCGSFKSIAICHCIETRVPAAYCNDVNQIHSRMNIIFGSQQKACNYQKDTTPQECMDDWNCYRLGGKDSQGLVCNGTALPCP